MRMESTEIYHYVIWKVKVTRKCITILAKKIVPAQNIPGKMSSSDLQFNVRRYLIFGCVW